VFGDRSADGLLSIFPLSDLDPAGPAQLSFLYKHTRINMSDQHVHVAIIGAGTIGLSFAALHLMKDPTCTVTIYDTRTDLQQYVQDKLPGYLVDADQQACVQRLAFASDIDEAVKSATIVQEQGPENLEFKRSLWPEIEKHVPKDALLWSSTSGIAASQQAEGMRDQRRLCVVHPFNPPHIMPLLEVVPSPQTSQDVIDRTLEYWRGRGRAPVVLRKECPGFVANRLAYALFREACSLVAQGVASVEDIDEIVQASMGPRWSVAGPFKSYHAGGGEGGLKSFMDKIGGSIRESWEASEHDVKQYDISMGQAWQKDICQRTEDAYGVINTAERDTKTRKVLAAVGRP